MVTTTEYISFPIIEVDTKVDNEIEEYFSKTAASKMKRGLSVKKIYDYNDESKRLIRELNEMVSKWK